jgi:hypothetical protein
VNDERLLREVGSWLQESDPKSPDARESVRHAMDQMPRVRQRSRWWPLPVFYRGTQTSTAIDTVAYQPSPIPASNGHTPTVIGRTSSMLSPAKALIAGAVVFAIGGVMFIAQPFQQQGILPGADGEACTTPVMPVTGTIHWGGEGSDTQRTVTESGEHTRDFVYDSDMAVSDDRLNGATTASDGAWDQSDVDGAHAGIYRGNRVIENAGGTWEGPETLVDDPDGDGFLSMMDLVGTGDYEGLTAVLFMDNTAATASFKGAIYPTDLTDCDFATVE